MSVICRTFVQNAWRSDLCSNCFKSLQDHVDSNGTRRNNVCEKLSVPRYVPQAATLYQSRGISTSLKWRLNESLYDRVSRRDIASQTPNSKMSGGQNQVAVEPQVIASQGDNTNSRGILVKSDSNAGGEKKFRSRPSVDFASEEALVIGYGGNDYDSDTSPWEMGSDDDISIDLDLLDDTDEDRKITRLTRNNTEFNSFNKNLLTSEEEKINTINNKNNKNNTSSNNNNKTINSVLTYNDIQSSTTKSEKKLNQYFFPSSTDIKSYLNGRGNSIVIEETILKNNNINEKQGKIQNCLLQKKDSPNVKNENVDSKVTSLNEDFTPLNTRTYSFVSELNKNNVSFEQSSDSDYSTCRHTTTGDSTDSESFHDSEESTTRPLTKSSSSFLHGTYAISSPPPPINNELDIDKKYDAGSSTSGDISNFSDDSDTHDVVPYKPRSTKITMSDVKTPAGGQNHFREEERSLHKRDEEEFELRHRTEKESPKMPESKQQYQPLKQFQTSPKGLDSKQQYQPSKSSNPKSRQSPPSTKHVISSTTPPSDKSNKNSSNSSPAESQDRDVSRKSIPSSNDSPQNVEKASKVAVSKASPMPSVQPSNGEVKRSPVSKTRELQESELSSRKEPPPNSNSSDVPQPDAENNCQVEPECLCAKVSEENLIENNDDSSKEQILRDKEFRDYDDHSDYDKSPDAIVKRQSKLAALALELELARRDSEAKANKQPSPPTLTTPPEVKMRYSVYSVPSNPTSPSENLPTIKKASAISCASRLSTLPDVLQETPPPAKQKKTKFSLKKLLKRNKDSGTFSPSSNNKEVNPKAWKKQTFDRNRLSLEIVHPMDLTSDVPTSADSTPTEEHRQIVSTHPGKFTFKGVSSRARSLSALPQLSSDDQSGCALLECRKMDTVPARKAGTVAERKKNRPSLVRTPSCSALPNRSTQQTTSDRTPPPKPPPPPSKCKAMHPPPPPPPPHSHPRSTKSSTNSPARPPPPKVPDPKSRSHSSGSSAQELHEQNHSDKEYANLGDIRSLLTPKKPQRPSAFSASHREEGEMVRKVVGEDTAHYETLPPTAEEEEDHYTYLDEAEAKLSKRAEARNGERPTQSKGSNKVEAPPCGRPWLDLQTSYAAIAAANYESLAELITTSLNESAEYFRRVEQSLKWRDFVVETEEHSQIIKEKAVYNALYKNESQDKVTLVVAPRKQQTTPQNSRNQTRYPVLASFSEPVPRSSVGTDNYVLQEPASDPSSVYVLQRSRVTTVGHFAESSRSDLANQSVHLRDYCFVLLQLIHTLKGLQAEGVEEVDRDLIQILVLVLVATDEDLDRPPVLVLFPEDKFRLTLSCDFSSGRKTLCQATLETMLHFLQVCSADELGTCVVNGETLAEPVAHTFGAIAKVLSEEKASSLSQAKGFLEYMLWGPVDVSISQSESEETLDAILQRWLDLQRAQMVKSTISHLQQSRKSLHSCLHVYEEYQLIFLLQASVKSLKNVISKL